MRLASYLTLLLTIFAFACGSSPKKILTPAEAIAAHKAPWDKLPVAERAAYADCGAATTAMTAVSTVWALVPIARLGGKPNPQTTDGIRYIAITMPQDGSDSLAVVQYRMEGTKIVYEYAIVINGTGQQILLDYYIKRALDTKALTGKEDPKKIFSLATGEYFCFYQQ